MAHILSKYPLTAEQCRQHKVPEPSSLVPVVFKKCGHPGQMFVEAAKGRTEIEGFCWGCARARY